MLHLPVFFQHFVSSVPVECKLQEINTILWNTLSSFQTVLHCSLDHPFGWTDPPHPLLCVHRQGKTWLLSFVLCLCALPINPSPCDFPGEGKRQTGPKRGAGAVQHREQCRPEGCLEHHTERGRSRQWWGLVLCQWFLHPELVSSSAVEVLWRDEARRLVQHHAGERRSRQLLPAASPEMWSQRVKCLLDTCEMN